MNRLEKDLRREIKDEKTVFEKAIEQGNRELAYYALARLSALVSVSRSLPDSAAIEAELDAVKARYDGNSWDRPAASIYNYRTGEFIRYATAEEWRDYQNLIYGSDTGAEDGALFDLPGVIYMVE